MSFDLQKVTFRYPKAKPGQVSLRDVTVNLPAGQVIAVLGPSGCGKTTLLNLLALLWEGDLASGTIEYDDGVKKHPYAELNGDSEKRAELRRDYFGVVLQNCYLLPHFTCLQNVCLPLALQGWAEAERSAWAEALLRKADANFELPRKANPDRPVAPESKTSGPDQEAGLWGVRNNMPRAVSLGQKQRMAVLRALVHNPRVVFADEPISNLDPASTHAILQMLLDWQQGLLHRDYAKAWVDSAPHLPARLRERLLSWQEPQAGARTLFLVCHHIETAKACADLALVFNEDHRLIGEYTPADWPRMDAELNKLLASPPLMKASR